MNRRALLISVIAALVSVTLLMLYIRQFEQEMSGGERIPHPRHMDRHEQRLKRYQRRLARCQKGSANRAKARVKVARAHARVLAHAGLLDAEDARARGAASRCAE